MSRGLIKVQVIGNLGADPESRYTQQGQLVANFRVAVNRTRRGDGGDLVTEVEWFRVVAWDSPNRKLAEMCGEYLRKGRRVYVEGRLQSRRYTDRDGIERIAIEIVASDVIMLDGREEGGAAIGDAPAIAGAGAAEGRRETRPRVEDLYDDDELGEVPF
jgi:single-strand DNA-binding protein